MNTGTARRDFPVACVIIGRAATEPADAGGGDELAARVAIAHEAGAEPVIAVVGGDTVVPPPARRVVCSGTRTDADVALRLGLSQLTSVAVSAALIWPADVPDATLVGVLAVLDAAKRTGDGIVAPVRGNERLAPVFVVRDLWRELLTTSGGLGAVLAMHVPRTTFVDVGAL